MNLKEYFEFTETTKEYPNLVEYDYLVHGIWGEIGEFESIIAKRLRGDERYKDDEVYVNALKSELGDIYWFLVRLIFPDDNNNYGSALEDTSSNNVKSLSISITNIKYNLLDHSYFSLLSNLDSICRILGTTRKEVLELNVKKLTERKNTNTIKGNGETVSERFSLGSK